MRRRILIGIGLTLCVLLLIACSGDPLLLPEPLIVTLPADWPTPSPLPTIPVPATDTAMPESTAAAHPVIVLPTPTPYPDDRYFLLGLTVEGRPIRAWQFGSGPDTIVLIGGIHGGYEANTVALAGQLINYFRTSPESVLPGIRLVIIPVANPDGLAHGEGLKGRFNAHGVDLNRNWGCDWAETAYLHDEEVNPGPYPFSEPETRALRAYFIAEPPAAVIFYHSALGGIFMGVCGEQHPPADWMGELLAEATGYPHETFTHYDVTGDATNWLAEQGIPAAVVELDTHTDAEFTRNLAGVMALQCHFALAGSAGVPPTSAVQHICAEY